jgi:endonuclease/exonuclease/phosphatase (EEP) superfamily protein YafD
MYQQQLKYPAPNWTNEILQLRATYNIEETDLEVAELSKEQWKKKVNEKVREKALVDLNDEAKSQKNAQSLLPYKTLSQQDYIVDLPPKQARKIFHIRTGTIDLRSIRKYSYNDATCSVCQTGIESV